MHSQVECVDLASTKVYGKGNSRSAVMELCFWWRGNEGSFEVRQENVLIGNKAKV